MTSSQDVPSLDELYIAVHLDVPCLCHGFTHYPSPTGTFSPGIKKTSSCHWFFNLSVVNSPHFWGRSPWMATSGWCLWLKLALQKKQWKLGPMAPSEDRIHGFSMWILLDDMMDLFCLTETTEFGESKSSPFLCVSCVSCFFWGVTWSNSHWRFMVITQPSWGFLSLWLSHLLWWPSPTTLTMVITTIAIIITTTHNHDHGHSHDHIIMIMIITRYSTNNNI